MKIACSILLCIWLLLGYASAQQYNQNQTLSALESVSPLSSPFSMNCKHETMLRFSCSPSSVTKVSYNADSSILVFYNTQDQKSWQERLSLFSSDGREQWQYVVSSHDLNSGWSSRADMVVDEHGITLKTSEIDEYADYVETILNWDGTVSKETNIEIHDDMRFYMRDFPSYWIKEFYTHGQIQIISKTSDRSVSVDVPGWFNRLIQADEELIIISPLDNGAVQFQIIDHMGNRQIIEDHLPNGFDFSHFIGTYDRKAYLLFERYAKPSEWMICSIDLEKCKLNMEPFSISFLSRNYTLSATTISEGMVFSQYDPDLSELRFTLLKWDGTTEYFNEQVPFDCCDFISSNGDSTIWMMLRNKFKGSVYLMSYAQK